MSVEPFGPVVTVDWLAAHASEVCIADTRWYLPGSGRSGAAEYAAGHLPAAVFLDVDGDLADPPSPAEGRHPLPSPARFEAAMARVGISDTTRVVACDDQGGATAARLWWLMRYFGHDGQAAVLDGGIQGWVAAGHPLTRDVLARARAVFHATPHAELVVTREDVEKTMLDPRHLLLDARAKERWAGETEPVDARPGHIPGARSAPYAGNLDDEGRFFRSPQDLRDSYETYGFPEAESVAVYCGSGVTACHDLLALELAGLRGARLYAGSYSQWAADPKLPVEKSRR